MIYQRNLGGCPATAACGYQRGESGNNGISNINWQMTA